MNKSFVALILIGSLVVPFGDIFAATVSASTTATKLTQGKKYGVTQCYELNAYGKKMTNKLLTQYNKQIKRDGESTRLSILKSVDMKLQTFEKNRSLSNAIIYTAVLNELSGYQDADDISCNEKQNFKKILPVNGVKTKIEIYVDSLQELSQKAEQALMWDTIDIHDMKEVQMQKILQRMGGCSEVVQFQTNMTPFYSMDEATSNQILAKALVTPGLNWNENKLDHIAIMGEVVTLMLDKKTGVCSSQR